MRSRSTASRSISAAGAAFPEAYVWFQTNHFDQPRVSLTASVAIIPWLGASFPGFIIGLWRDGILHRFATYTGARIERLRITDDHIDWTVSGRTHPPRHGQARRRDA